MCLPFMLLETRIPKRLNILYPSACAYLYKYTNYLINTKNQKIMNIHKTDDNCVVAIIQ